MENNQYKEIYKGHTIKATTDIFGAEVFVIRFGEGGYRIGEVFDTVTEAKERIDIHFPKYSY